MDVILGQLRFPAITNEEVWATIPKYVDVVVKLVSRRQRCGRVEELGGEETVSRFFALYEVCIQSVVMVMANKADYELAYAFLWLLPILPHYLA